MIFKKKPFPSTDKSLKSIAKRTILVAFRNFHLFDFPPFSASIVLSEKKVKIDVHSINEALIILTPVNAKLIRKLMKAALEV